MSLPSQPIFKKAELQAGKAEVSMAPLIDVVFLLLIFFMVTTVFPENRALVIQKPESEVAEKMVMKKITFVVGNEGQIEFKGQAIQLQDIKRLVEEQLRSLPDTAVLVQIDKNAPTELFIKVLDACKLGGAKQVGIATDAVKPATR